MDKLLYLGNGSIEITSLNLALEIKETFIVNTVKVIFLEAQLLCN